MGFYSNKTILITGATGLIGSHLVDTFLKMGDVNVIALSRSEEKLKTAFSKYILNPHFKIIAQDIADKLDVNIGNVDFIFHAACSINQNVVKDTPIDVIVPNLNGTLNCLEYLKAQREVNGHSGRIILFSSVTVYGNASKDDLCVSENMTETAVSLNAPNAPYAESKRMLEVMATAYNKQFNVDVVIARLSRVYGDVCFVPDTAIYEFINKAISGEDIILKSCCTPKRDNIFVSDAVSGLLCIAEKGICCEAYNISSNGDLDNYVTVSEMAETVAKISKEISSKDVSVKYKDESNKGRLPGIKLDNSKLKALGWKIEVSFYEGVTKTYDSFLKQSK